MRVIDFQDRAGKEISPDRIQAQLETMIQDEVFRSSKRSVAFLKYVVTEALLSYVRSDNHQGLFHPGTG